MLYWPRPPGISGDPQWWPRNILTINEPSSTFLSCSLSSPPPLCFLGSPSKKTAAAKSLQLCPTLCDPIDGSPPGSPIPGILQARTLEWVAISFSNVWKRQVKVKSLSCVRLLATPWTAAYQAPPSMGLSRQEYWSGVPVPSAKKPASLKSLSLWLLLGATKLWHWLTGVFPEVFSLIPCVQSEAGRKSKSKSKSKSLSHVWLFATPWTVACGILQTRIPVWVAFPFSSGSSQPRKQTRVCCMAGGFFTNWAIREYHWARKGADRKQGLIYTQIQVSDGRFGWVLVAQSCPSLCDPMDCSPPGSSVHGILQARVLEWVAMPFSRRSSQPRDGAQDGTPTLQADSLSPEPPEKHLVV